MRTSKLFEMSEFCTYSRKDEDTRAHKTGGQLIHQQATFVNEFPMSNWWIFACSLRTGTIWHSAAAMAGPNPMNKVPCTHRTNSTWPTSRRINEWKSNRPDGKGRKEHEQRWHDKHDLNGAISIPRGDLGNRSTKVSHWTEKQTRTSH